MADNLLDKASILLTPTAYNDGSMLSVKPENGDGDFTFSRSSAATRVNAQGLVENVQIISSELVSNGNFSQIGTEEVSNGNFSQEGSELVTNGDFSNGTTDWTPNASATLSIDTGRLKIAISGEASGYAKQDIFTIESGKQYKCTGTVDFGTASQMRFYVSNTGQFFDITQSGNFNFTFTSTGTSTQIRLYTYGDGNYGFWDNISVKEVGQDWTLGTGWSIGEDKASRTAQSGSTSMYQSVSFTANKSYKITYDLDISAGSFLLRIGGGALIDTTPRTTSGTYTEYIVANSGNNVLNLRAVDGNFIGSITNISVKEVGQDWILGSGWSIGDGVALNSGGANFSDLTQLNTNITIGKNYKITYTVSDYVSGSFKFIMNSNTTAGLERNADGTYTDYLTSAAPAYSFRTQGSGFTGSITNISVKEITDDTDLPRINYEGFSYQDSLGSELVVNGNDTSNIVGLADNQNINIQSSFLTLNKTYKITFEIYDYVEGSIFLLRPNNLGAGTAVSANGTYSYTVLANASISLIFRTDGLSTTLKLKNISVKEYLGQEVVPDSGCGSWLLEKQSTNLITQSELFSDASWRKQATIVDANSIISADGTQNASKIQSTQTGSAFVSVSYPTLTVGNTYTFSCFAKKGNNDWIRLAHISSTGTGCWFDLENGVVGTVNSQSATIEDYGNGWYKCTNTFIATASTDANLVFIGICDADGSTNAGAIGQNDYLWGAQLENQSFSTSYIPTSGAANTRLQDIANNSGNSTLINSTEGVLYAEIAALANDETERQISIDDGNGSNRIVLRYNSTSNNVNAYLYNSGVQGGEFNHTLSDITSFAKVAFKWKTNDFALWVNGVEVGSDSSGASFLANTLNDISFDFNGLFPFYGKNKALAVYKEALTDANLRSLTYPNPVATTFDLDFDTIAEQFTFTRGSEATFVNAQGLIESTASNDAPRIDYSTGAKAFLLEPQSTNLITYSEDFSNSYWIKNGASVTSGFLSPDGTANAFKLVEDTSTGTHRIRISSLASGAAASKEFTYSFFVKKSEVKWFLLKGVVNTQSLTVDVWFDLENGVVGTESNGVGSIENYGNDWYRCSINIATNSSATSINLYGYLSDDDNSESYQGDGTSGVYIYGAMLEQQSYSTSYIPSSGASATRNQELCNNATPVINSEEGTLYAEISALANDGLGKYYSISDGTSSNRIRIGYSFTNNTIRTLVISQGSNVVDYTHTISDVKSFSKVGFSYKQNEFTVWIDGIKVHTDTSGNTPINLSRLSFDDGKEVGTGGYFLGNTKGLKYYPKALADVQLEDLTTI